MAPKAVLERHRPVSSALVQVQRRALRDHVLAHDLGLYHYWRARHLDSQAMPDRAAEAWRRVVAAWALVLDDDGYWHDWAQARSIVYGSEIADGDVKAAREQLRDRLDQDLSARPQADGSPAGDGDPLDVLLDLEMSGLRALRAAGGLPLDGDTKTVCGPLMIQQLDLSTAFGSFVAGLAEVDNAPTEAFAQLMRLLGEDANPLQGEMQTRDRLLRYFSQLGVPAVYLDRSQPKAALASLTNRCGHPAAVQEQRARRSSLEPGALPVVCQASCPSFAECNPAHAAVRNGASLLASDSARMAVEAHMALAELAIATDLEEVPEAVAEWELALELSVEVGERARTRDAIVDTLVGRAAALKSGGRLDDAIALLEATQDAYADGELTGKLAQLLTDRGVRAGNDERWEESVADLRRAREINPSVPRTRDNLVTALRGLAASRLSEGPETAEPPLREAVSILEDEIASEGSDPRLRDTLREVRGELAITGLARIVGTAGVEGDAEDTEGTGASGLTELAEALRGSGPQQPRRSTPARPAGEEASSRFAGMMGALGVGSSQDEEPPAPTDAPADAGSRAADGDRFSNMMSILQGGSAGTRAPTSSTPRDGAPTEPASPAPSTTGAGSESDRVASMMEAFGRGSARGSTPTAPAPRPSPQSSTPRASTRAPQRTTAQTGQSAEPKPATRNWGCLIPMLLSIALVGIALGTDLLGSGPYGGLGIWQIVAAGVGLAVFLASYQAFRSGG